MTRVDSAHARESLRYALPYLVFTFLPIHDLVTAPNFGGREAVTLALLAAMVVVYVSMWIVNPVAPVGRRATPMFVFQTSLFCAVLVAMLIVGGTQYPGLLFMPTYLLTSWILLAPRHTVPLGAIMILGATVGAGLIIKAPISLMLTALVVAAMSSSVLMVRISIDTKRGRDFRKEQEHQLQFERERAQMNSDLHDLLGQDLTGLSIKADLADRLLEAGRTDEARDELRDLARLSRQALEDVRAVVRKGREWSLDRELASAADLLTARDIALHLEGTETALPGVQAGILARVIRESITNLLHHADPLNCWIRVSSDLLVVENDGYSPGRSRATFGSGQGLLGLRDAAASLGVLTWGPGGAGWRVTLEMKP